MKIHLFNPEHDIALATNVVQFTAPRAGRVLRADLGFIPALWADEGDVVVVDNVEDALESVSHFKKYTANVTFVSLNELHGMFAQGVEGVELCPWGWDVAVANQFRRADKRLAALLPDEEVLRHIREISNRRFAAEKVLPEIVAVSERCVGTSTYCANVEDVQRLVSRTGRCVLKSPWSSSGRGIRYVCDALQPPQLAWVANIIARQGGVMVEPYYNKVMDFGVELYADGCGNIDYKGLSLFQTVNGAYTGNLLATEDDKLRVLSKYVPEKLFKETVEEIIKCLSPQIRTTYKGVFGVDMMVTSDNKRFMLHPCVEINFRRTMGHVALALSPAPFEPQRLMRIDYDGHYHLKLTALQTEY